MNLNEHKDELIAEEQRIVDEFVGVLKKDISAQSYAMIGLDEKTYRNIGKTLARNIIEECWNKRA